MFGDLKSGPRWNSELPHVLGVQFHLQNLKFKIPTNFLALRAKSTKFRCLVIWNRAPVELWGPPRIGGPIPPSKPWIQNTHQKVLFFEPNLLNLDVWWFEIGAPVELWGPPRFRGPIPPSKPQIQNTNNFFWLWAKFAKFRCLVIWNRGSGGIMSQFYLQNTYQKYLLFETKY
jgi:hypothetical protein